MQMKQKVRLQSQQYIQHILRTAPFDYLRWCLTPEIRTLCLKCPGFRHCPKIASFSLHVAEKQNKNRSDTICFITLGCKLHMTDKTLVMLPCGNVSGHVALYMPKRTCRIIAWSVSVKQLSAPPKGHNSMSWLHAKMPNGSITHSLQSN